MKTPQANQPKTSHPNKPTSPSSNSISTSVDSSLKGMSDSKKEALEKIFGAPEEEAPLVKSVGYLKVPGKRSYVSFVITSKNLEIINIEIEEPDLKAIAEESAKVSFVRVLMNQEEMV